MQTVKNYPEYCAVIRTLGKSGDKYLTTLQSLCKQTVRPKKILVYIAEGYDIPKETVGVEQYIRCRKGMVAQRAVGYEEADTDYLLMLDDDIYLPERGVEKLFDALREYDADCVIPETFVAATSFRQLLRCAVEEWILPSRFTKWGFKIRKSSAHTYRVSPKKDAYPTQSGAGCASLCRKSAFLAVHFEDERWIDSFRYALGEDQLLFYKMYRYGYKLLLHLNSGIVHLNAKSSYSLTEDEFSYNSIKLNFIIWWRTQLVPAGFFGKIACAAAFFSLFVWQTLFRALFALKRRKPSVFSTHLKAYADAWRYVHSSAYRAVPPFMKYFRGK